MHGQASTAAEQLRSVAGRYQRTLCPRRWSLPRGAAVPPHRRWLLAAGAGASRGEDGLDARLQRLEAVLFLAREPLSSRKLSDYANLADGTEARTLIRRLNEQYDETGRAFRVEEFAGGFQLLTRPQFASWLRRLEHVPPETRLSAPALETLAVVAYRQPVLRADIEAIRGVSCGEILRQLMERDLVRIGGRSEELGRPYLYATTKRFLQLMGLPKLDQLPRAESLRQQTAPHAGATETGVDDSPATPQTESTTTSHSESDVSRDDRQPENASMMVTDAELKTLPDADDPANTILGIPVTPHLSADDEDEEEEYEYEYEDDDEEDYDEDEGEEDEAEEEDEYDEDYEDEDEEEDEDEDFEEEDFEEEELEDEEEDEDEYEEEDDEEWEEVDDEEEWDDDDMDWEDEYDEMD